MRCIPSGMFIIFTTLYINSRSALGIGSRPQSCAAATAADTTNITDSRILRIFTLVPIFFTLKVSAIRAARVLKKRQQTRHTKHPPAIGKYTKSIWTNTITPTFLLRASFGITSWMLRARPLPIPQPRPSHTL